MTTPTTLLVTLPVTVPVGSIPAAVTGDGSLFSYGLATAVKAIQDAFPGAGAHNQHATVTFSGGSESPTLTAGLQDLTQRAYRVIPEDSAFKLELSTDLGDSFAYAGTFHDEVFANAIGGAWSEGRVENVD